MLNNERTKYQAFAFASPNQPITRPTKRTGEALNPKAKYTCGRSPSLRQCTGLLGIGSVIVWFCPVVVFTVSKLSRHTNKQQGATLMQ